MKKLIALAFVAGLGAMPMLSHAQTTQAASSSSAAAPYYTVEDSTIGDLLDNPATKAVLAKYLPEMVASDQISQASGMTLKAIQQYAPDKITDEVLGKIDAELAKIPAPKS